MKIAIIGGGFTGLTSAYYLSKKGHQITIYEKNQNLGGLASSFKLNNWQWSLEKYYHHFFSNDNCLKELIKELEQEKKVFFEDPMTSIYLRHSISQFDTPLSLLTFPYLSLVSKIRTAIILLFLKISPPFEFLEKVTAYQFLEKTIGRESFQLLFEPLLIGKFAIEAKNITALWFWARIKKRTKKLGYYFGGFQELINDLSKKLKEKKVEICLNQEVKNIKKDNNKFIIFDEIYDSVIATCPSLSLTKIAPFLPACYLKKLSKIKHLSSLSLILITDKPILEKTYWLNINETAIPFVSLVQHTNFIDKKYYGGNYLTYIGNYLPPNHQFLKKSKEELLKIFLPFIKKIIRNSQFAIRNSFLFKDNFSQTVVTSNYSTIKPDIETPIKNLYLGNIDVVYPWDRGVNYAIELGEIIAQKINNELL